MSDPMLKGLTGPVTLDEVVAARAPWDAVVRKGQTLRIVDLEGNQAVDFLMYALADDAERLAFAYVDGDAVDRLDVADGFAQHAALDRKPDF